jgi:hypothetical protein
MSFGTLAEALTAAQHQEPPADPEAWLDPEQFQWPSASVASAGHGRVRSRLASHIHSPAGGVTPVAWAVRGALAVAVLFAVTYVVYRLPYWIGLDTPQARSSALDWAMITLLLVTAAGVAVWVGVHATAALVARARVTGHPAEVLAVPTTLRVTGRTRFLISLGWMCSAAFCFILAALADTEEGDIAVAALFVALGLPQVVLAVRGFPRAIVADDRGVTIHNLFRRVTNPWHELRSIDYKQVDTEGFDGLYYKLTFNGRITAEVPAGQNQPGGYLHTLRDTLLRMQQRH